MEDVCAIILAGGKGKRMNSDKPKVLSEVLFTPMLEWVISNIEGAGIDRICVVTGYRAEMVDEYLGGRYETAYQAEQLGTGHAVMQAREFLEKCRGDVLVLNGDAPFVDSDTIRNSLTHHRNCSNAATVITATVDDPTGYGRILRDENGFLSAIREEKDATPEEKRIKEVNSGAFWFNCGVLLNVLGKLTTSNAAGEYYLTDAIDIIISMVMHAGAYISGNPGVAMGANSRAQLAGLNETARRMLIERAYENGADIPCTDGVIIGRGVEIGRDTLILPGTILTGSTSVGNGCVIGPNTSLRDVTVGNGTRLDNVRATNATVGSGCDIGPFVQIRPNTEIHDNVHLGNFVEVKNSVIDDGTKVSHLTYVGDSDVGKNVNFGCGTVTVNYDGKNKHRTSIGDNSFIGCNTNLIAPVKIGSYGFTAAGSTITDDVPDGSMGIARSRQTNKLNWVFDRRPLKNMPENPCAGDKSEDM